MTDGQTDGRLFSIMYIYIAKIMGATGCTFVFSKNGAKYMYWTRKQWLKQGVDKVS